MNLRDSVRLPLLLFVSISAIYGLTAWDRVLEPSPHFHFVDMAHSFAAGQLHTDTPRQNANRSKPDDPPGYREAIKRTLDSGGWNDWAALRVVTLKDGMVLRGRFPWADAQGEQKRTFHTLDGESWQVDTTTDLSTTCEGRPGKRCAG